MRRFVYHLHSIGLHLGTVSFGIAACIALLTFTDTNITDPQARLIILLNYFSWTTSLFVTIMMFQVFRPEDASHIDTFGTLPLGLTSYVRERTIAGVLLVVLPLSALYLFIGFVSNSLRLNALLNSIVFLAAAASICSGITLVGMLVGKKISAGVSLALLFVFVMFLVSNPVIVTPIYMQPQLYNSAFALPYFIYLVIGITLFWVASSMLGKTSRLYSAAVVSGTLPRLDFLKKLLHKTWKFIPFISSKAVSNLIIYEVYSYFLKGWIPITLVVACIIFTFLTLVSIDAPIRLVDSLPRTITLLIYIVIPSLSYNSISLDIKGKNVETLLVYASPAKYLSVKTISLVLAILVSIILGLLPGVFISAILSIFHGTNTFIAFLIVLPASIFPVIIYATVVSMFLGAATISASGKFLGPVISVVMVVLLFVTANTVIGNIIFPSGFFTSESLVKLLLTNSTTNVFVDISQISRYLIILLSMVSPFVQLFLIWKLVIKRFKRLYWMEY